MIDQNTLSFSSIAHELQGHEHDVGVSLILIDAAPGRGPSLHRHPYEEIFIVQEGQATFTVGEEEKVVEAGNIVIVPPHQPHGFVNSGDGPLRQIAIHLSPRFDTEWLE